MQQVKKYLPLHLLLLLFSFSSICSKLAGRQSTFSFWFVFWYGLVVVILGTYAIFWQQIIKRMPLSSAYANKAITVVWGMIWGLLIFNESITIQKLLGALIVVTGVVLFAFSEKGGEPEDG